MTACVVRTTAGWVEGVVSAGVAVFGGIPYAAAPCGDLRFRPPTPRAPWDGVRDATRFGPIARQCAAPGSSARLVVAELPEGDDCLTVNVWSPSIGRTGLPVLVWIHGGAFQAGAGSWRRYDGSALARRGIVVVSMNYRLGTDGFLHIASDVAGSGTFGLLDQIAALAWVRDNIAAFGGDPDAVTIAGQSSGGMSVGFLLGMPTARGLFHRAIAQSGACHNGYSIDVAERVAERIRRRAGAARGDVASWQAVPIDRLREAEQVVIDEAFKGRDTATYGELGRAALRLPFQPTIGLEEAPTSPIDAVAAGAAAGVDVLCGCNAEEFRSMLALAPDAFGLSAGREREVLAAEAEIAFGTAERAAAAIDVYRRGPRGDSPVEVLGALSTDWGYRIPAIRLAEAQQRHGRTYVYSFAWRSPALDGRMGAGHGVEIPFVFGTLDEPTVRHSVGDDPPRDLSAAVQESWAAFVTSGDPSTPAWGTWPSYDPATRSTMVIDERTRVVHDPSATERELWSETPA